MTCYVSQFTYMGFTARFPFNRNNLNLCFLWCQLLHLLWVICIQFRLSLCHFDFMFGFSGFTLFNLFSNSSGALKTWDHPSATLLFVSFTKPWSPFPSSFGEFFIPSRRVGENGYRDLSRSDIFWVLKQKIGKIEMTMTEKPDSWDAWKSRYGFNHSDAYKNAVVLGCWVLEAPYQVGVCWASA